jgi:hypothetical protein
MNGYEKHGIRHSSPSAINKWINAPDAWVSSYLFGHKGRVSAAMWRGICVEDAVVHILTEAEGDGVAKALDRFDNETIFLGDPSAEKERANIPLMVGLAVDALAEYGRPEFPDGGHQHKVSLTAKGDGWALPFIGFLDLVFPAHGLVVDIKTTGRMPSTMSMEHQRQRAFYASAMGNHAVKFLYVTPKKVAMLEDGDPAELMAEIKVHMNRQEAFLRLGDKELLRSVVPVNPSSFYWRGDETIRKELYGV